MKHPGGSAALQDLTYNELVKYVANNPQEQSAWREFVRRFDDCIRYTIVYKLKRLNGCHGMSPLEDLTQQVYEKLVESDCKRLKQFKGKHENSIFSYLKMVALHQVINEYRSIKSKKNQPPGGILPLDGGSQKDQSSKLIDLIESDNLTDKQLLSEFKDEIEYHVNEILKRTRHKGRDKLMFYCHLYDGLSIEEIAAYPEINISPKRAENIIWMIKKELRRRLRK